MDRIRSVLLGIAGLALVAASAQASTHEFFKEKTVRIIVGFSPGGGFDIYSRTIARHLGKHIPGNPTIVVENMTGAASLIAANHVYKIAKADGLAIGNFNGGVLLGQVLEWRGIEFDAQKFEYIGVPARNENVCAFTKKSGITSLEKWQTAKTPVKLGGAGPGTTTDDVPKILKPALGLPIHLVSGYKGTAVIRLAAEAGEVAGMCLSWDSLKAMWGRAIELGDVVVVLQTMPRPRPDLPAVPLAINYAKTEEARQLVRAGIHDRAAIIFLYALPPGTLKDRVQILRAAFMDTMRDAEFLAEAEKSRLDVDPVSGDEVERIVRGFFQLSPGIVGKLREVLK